MKKIRYIMLGVFMFSFVKAATEVNVTGKTAYDFSFKTLVDEQPLPLKQFAGKVLLIVNTASNCGLTPQYAGLEQLYNTYKDNGLVVIGVPSNDFGSQEPGNNRDISSFCTINYGVTFPMTSKEVVSGDKACPFYIWAKQTLGFGTAPKWNFHKYLINRQGVLIDYFNSTTAPDSPKIKSAIEKALAEKP
jgi:glutathione peroxidase